MSRTLPLFTLLLFTIASCQQQVTETSPDQTNPTKTNNQVSKSGYADGNGIRMYYELHGEGQPLVLIHGGGSTIETSFGRIIPLLSKNRQLVCVELQAHGRTGDRNAPISFEQDADDVAALLKNLGIGQADVFGFSNGANTALHMGLRHPGLCRKIIAGSPLLKKNGTAPQFWEFMKNGTFEQMPQQYKEAFMKVNPDSVKLRNMYGKCAERMINFREFADEQIKSLKMPILLINGDQDVATSEHIAAMSKMIPNCRLAIIPGGHGAYMGEITTIGPDFKESGLIVPLIEKFLDEKFKE
jgi:pimeloyl-ACP methyl ester carboxylesterase